MPELQLQRNGDLLETHFGELHASTLWSNITDLQLTAEKVHEYGHDLFDQVTQEAQLRAALITLPEDARLVLLAEEPEVMAIPWEYMRLPESEGNLLLAARSVFVRGIAESNRKDAVVPTCPLTIVAVPVSPVDEEQVLNTEGEWSDLARMVRKQEYKLTLTRTRPPTLAAMKRALSKRGTNIVQFMGHSGVSNGHGVLAFENELGKKQYVEAPQLRSFLEQRTFLVVLNSCQSAVTASAAPQKYALSTPLSNIAEALVQKGIPYALGMQFSLPDDAALHITTLFYESLLKGSTVEEAVRDMRAELEQSERLFHAKTAYSPEINSRWLAGLPVLYTNQREAAPALDLEAGQPNIQPNLEQLNKTCDLNALPTPAHFVGRGEHISDALALLLNPSTQGFVVLHGLGGIGKTALSRIIAERVSYHYDDHVFAYSFETFTRFDSTGKEVVNEQFAPTFYSTLASYYGLDPQQLTPERTLQNAIIAQRKTVCSLLVLDNIETLIEAQKRNDEQANSLAAFVSRLKEDRNVVLLTSREMPPADWGASKEIHLSGLNDGNGAKLFFSSLADDRRAAANGADCLALSQYVRGHPLSIRLLAGRFSDDNAKNLHDFLTNVQNELASARQKTPHGEDPNRHATLSECLAYSIRRLSDEQKQVFYTLGIFVAPFTPSFAEDVLDDKEQTRKHLQDFVRLGLLEVNRRDFEGEGYIMLYEMHPMLRQHIKAEAEKLESNIHERYGLVYENLARQAQQPQGGADSNAAIRYLIMQSLPDCETALQEEALSPSVRSSLAYHLAPIYQRRGQVQHAMTLYKDSLAISQQLGDMREIAIRQGMMARLLVRQGQVQAALELFEQSLASSREINALSDIAVTQYAMADLLRQQGKISDAMALYQDSLKVYQDLGDVRSVAVTQGAMAAVLRQQGKISDAMALYQDSLQTKQELGDLREVAITQNAMTDLLVQQGNVRDAMALYQDSLKVYRDLGDVRSVAVTQGAMADVLVQQGNVRDAMALYQDSLQTKQELGDLREVAITQNAMADVLMQQGKLSDALALYQESLKVYQELGDVRNVAVTQSSISQLLWAQEQYKQALVLMWQTYRSLPEVDFPRDVRTLRDILISWKEDFSGDEQQFEGMWLEATAVPQPDWLRDAQVASAGKASGQHDEGTQKILDAIVAFVNTPDWDASEQVLQERQEVLFQDGVEAVFEQLIEQYKDDERATRLLEQHLAILRACKVDGIEKTFERVKAMQAGGGDEEEEDVGEEDGTEEAAEQQAAGEAFLASLPFDGELIPRSIAALVGGPQERMAHMHYLAALTGQSGDEQLKALVHAIQLAMLGGDLTQLGNDLGGVYEMSWNIIVANVGG